MPQDGCAARGTGDCHAVTDYRTESGGLRRWKAGADVNKKAMTVIPHILFNASLYVSFINRGK